MPSDEKYFIYGGYYHGNDGNLGDRLIPRYGIDLIRRHSDVYHHNKFAFARNKKRPDIPMYQEDEVKNIKGLIIGAGGLFTGKHSTKSKKNKVFLNFNSEDARRLSNENIPVFFWTTGVNSWSNKNFFTEEIKKEIEAILAYTKFAFLRGTADIEFLKSFLPNELHSKLIFQPCASFFLDQLRSLKARPSIKGKKRVAINVAADHIQEFYYLSESNQKSFWKTNQKTCVKDFAIKFRKSLEVLDIHEFDSIFFCNTKEDAEFAAKFFPDYKRIESHRISSTIMAPEELYTQFDFCIGMRLHSWLPFLGLNIPSLFITPFGIRSNMTNDLGLNGLAYRFTEETEKQLPEKIHLLLSESERWKTEIHNAKKNMTDLSMRNVKLLTENFKK